MILAHVITYLLIQGVQQSFLWLLSGRVFVVQQCVFHRIGAIIFFMLIKVFFYYQLIHKRIVLKRNIKMYIKTAPKCFGMITIIRERTMWACSHSTLPDDGDHTETCWSYFNINFNTLFLKQFSCVPVGNKILWL